MCLWGVGGGRGVHMRGGRGGAHAFKCVCTKWDILTEKRDEAFIFLVC